jgi:hypothetical protein
MHQIHSKRIKVTKSVQHNHMLGKWLLKRKEKYKEAMKDYSPKESDSDPKHRHTSSSPPSLNILAFLFYIHNDQQESYQGSEQNWI